MLDIGTTPAWIPDNLPITEILSQLNRELVSREDGPKASLPFIDRYEAVMGWPMPGFQKQEIVPLLKDDGPRELLILAPPGHSKSTLISYLAADILGRNPNERIIWATHTTNYSILALQYIEDIMTTPAFKSMYGNLIPSAGTTTWQATRKYILRSDWRGRHPSLLALGVGSETPGYRATTIFIDDLVTQQNSQTQTTRGHLSNWFFGSLVNRLDPGGRIIGVGARFFKQDLYGVLKDFYHTVEFTATPEQPLWPERYPPKLLEQARLLNYYLYLAQFEQNPVDLNAGFLKESDLHYYYELPELYAFFQGIDPSQKLRSKAKIPRQPDFFSQVMIGVDRNKTGYLVDAQMIRASHAQQKADIVAMARRWNPQLIYFETDAGQIHFFEEMATEYPELPFVDVTSEGVSKPVRLANMASYVRRGQVLLPGTITTTGMTMPTDLAYQLHKSWTGYPNAPDDILDALERAVRAAFGQGVMPATGMAMPKAGKYEGRLQRSLALQRELYQRGLDDYKPIFERVAA